MSQTAPSRHLACFSYLTQKPERCGEPVHPRGLEYARGEQASLGSESCPSETDDETKEGGAARQVLKRLSMTALGYIVEFDSEYGSLSDTYASPKARRSFSSTCARGRA